MREIPPGIHVSSIFEIFKKMSLPGNNFAFFILWCYNVGSCCGLFAASLPFSPDRSASEQIVWQDCIIFQKVMTSTMQAILFDFDGVIVDSMRYHAEAWQKIFRGHGVQIEQHEILEQEGRRVEDVVATILAKHGRKANGTLSQEIGRQKRELFLNEHRDHIRPFPGAEKLVAELAQRDVRLGLVTGTYRRSLEKLLAREIRERFHVIVTAEDTKHGKPAPDPYLAAAERIDLAPADCLVVENAPLGIQSARAAGMRVVAVTTTLPPEYLHEADVVCRSFEELGRYLQSSMADSSRV